VTDWEKLAREDQERWERKVGWRPQIEYLGGYQVTDMTKEKATEVVIGNHVFYEPKIRDRSPANDVPVEPVSRNCLCCGREFVADGRFLRLCSICRSKE
jgi:hypothetical protein